MFSPQFRRLGGPALTAGGLLWIAIYTNIVLIGASTGQLALALDAHSPALVRIGAWVDILAVLVVGVGQWSVFARLNGRSRRLGIAGVVFTLQRESAQEQACKSVLARRVLGGNRPGVVVAMRRAAQEGHQNSKAAGR